MKIKSYLNLLAVMSVFAACQNETEILDAPLKGTEVTIEAVREGAGDSRTTLTEEFKINWHKDDSLSVFLGSNFNQKFTIYDGAGTDYATFKGSGDIFITGGSESSTGAFANVAYYPHNGNVQIAKGTDGAYTITTSLPYVQTYRQGSFGQDAYHMVAVAESNRDYAFTFKNVGSMFMLYLKGTAEITRIELESTANKLAGACTVTAAYGEEPTLSLDDNSADSNVTLVCTSEDEEGVTKGVQLSETESTVFVIAVPPIKGEANDLTFTIYDANYGYMEYKNAEAYSVARNKYYTFGATNAVEYKAAGYTEDYVQDANGNVKIYNAEGLKWFRDEVNKGTSFAGKTIELEADIDLNNEEWEPIVVVNNENLARAIFDGKSHTISNYKVTTSADTQNAALFGYVVHATLKNFTIDNAQIVYPDGYTGDGYGAAVLASGYTMTLENISVENSKIQGSNKVGGLIARHNENAKLTVTNCHVKNSTIESKNETDGGNVGGLIGYIDLGGAETNVITNSSVTGCTINTVNSTDSGKRANGQFVACVNSAKAAKLIITNCKVENNTYNEETTTYVSPFDGLLVGGERSTKTCTVVIDGKEYPIKPAYIGTVGYESLAAALAESEDGDEILVMAGEHKLDDATVKAANVTIKGENKETSIVKLSKSIYLQDKSITLENLTYSVPTGLTYNESAFAFIHHATEFNLTNCIVDGRLRLNVHKSAIDGCQFDITTSSGFDGYSLYYYGKPNSEVTVSNSTFDTAGKAIVIYNESAVAGYSLKVNTCTFTSSNTGTDKAAIQMHTEYGISGTLTVDNSTATGFADINGGLWNELMNNESGTLTDKFIKTVDGVLQVQTVAALNEAIKSGATTVALGKGTYNATGINAGGKTLTLKGIGDDVVLNIDQNNAVALGTFDGSKVTFENITISTPGGIYKGFARMEGTYNKCTFENLYFTFQGKHEFNGCVFNADGDEHCIWTYGADEVEFNDCNFNYSDRCVNVYTEAGIAEGKLTFTGCNFTTSNKSSKGAVEINSGSFTTSIKVDFDKCTKPAYGEMVFISGWDIANGSKATVTIDGTVATVPQLEK